MVLILAALLDAALGEPRAIWDRAPHPAVLMGRAVDALRRRLNRGADRQAKGIVTLTLLIAGAWILGLLLEAVPGRWLDVAVLAVLLAQRSLVDHVAAVADALRRGVPEGRAAVAMIVGRDTAAMDAPAVARAAIESGAENMSDGVIAPAMWFALGGLPGLLVYKVVNTADSMIGHRTHDLENFGWAAARADDVANWVPARVTAWLILPGLPRALGPLRADAALHRSPNAGWPEAAMARRLGVALSGPRSYFGHAQDLPWVNADGRHALGPADIDACIRALWSAWALGLALVGLVLLLR
ncbi:MAG: adenosylcobinamide-phosphate synthase CbiB [Paracoccaceae bacterium]